MATDLRVLGVIPARGGSRGLPGKNIAPVAGKPLLAYTLEAARAAAGRARCVLSSDDETILRVAREWGGDVPFVRPAELATDEAPMLPVLLHALDHVPGPFDAVMILQPTTPLRRPEDIDAAIRLLADDPAADAVISVVKVGDHHPARMKSIRDGVLVDPPFAELFEGQRRQELPELYLRNGAIYLTRTRVLREERSLKGRRCLAYVMPEERSVNIDGALDLLLAEAVLHQQQPSPPVHPTPGH